MWNVATGKVERSFATVIPDRIPKNMALSPDGARWPSPVWVGWACGASPTARTHELRILTPPVVHGFLQFSADGTALGVRDQHVNIWDLRTGALRKFDAPNSGNRNGWTFSADGQTAYVAPHGGQAVSKFRTGDWSVARLLRSINPPGEQRRRCRPTENCSSCTRGNPSFVLDADSGKTSRPIAASRLRGGRTHGQRFAGVHLNKYWVWDRASGLQEFVFPEDVILGYPMFSPDGRHLLTRQRQRHRIRAAAEQSAIGGCRLCRNPNVSAGPGQPVTGASGLCTN